MTIQNLKTKAVQLFSEKGFPTPFLDADCLLQFLLKKDKTFILLHKNDELNLEQEKLFLELVEQRLTGLPVAYITGVKEFYGREFSVTPKVLIPKPDTEILVEQAVKTILDMKKKSVRICDVCTGSGCVGLSIYEEVKPFGIEAELYLTDISRDALSVAERNAEMISGKNAGIKFYEGDLLCGLKNFDVIVSNPPYVPHKEVEELLLDGRNEPRLALDGDTDTAVKNIIESSDGLEIIKRLIPLAKDALVSGGAFLLESGEYQTSSIRDLMELNGFKDVVTWKDLSDQERITGGHI